MIYRKGPNIHFEQKEQSSFSNLSHCHSLFIYNHMYIFFLLKINNKSPLQVLLYTAIKKKEKKKKKKKEKKKKNQAVIHSWSDSYNEMRIFTSMLRHSLV